MFSDSETVSHIKCTCLDEMQFVSHCYTVVSYQAISRHSIHSCISFQCNGCVFCFVLFFFLLLFFCCFLFFCFVVCFCFFFGGGGFFGFFRFHDYIALPSYIQVPSVDNADNIIQQLRYVCVFALHNIANMDDLVVFS